jgi:uncharacterized protein YgbK (DUF1537 family)
MIAVIADDFTGAAELAGISLRYGLKVEVFLKSVRVTNADVIVVCTDSRSLNKAEAKKVTADAVRNVLKLKPSFIYKKIDSVLRGHVLDEINVQLEQSGLNKVLVLPANPSLGRRISEGEYFINGIRIHETGFAADPEFPKKKSSVIKMIGSEEVKVLKHTDVLPAEGIAIGEAETIADIKSWAAVIDNTWMLAGAGDFYMAILEKGHQQQSQPQAILLSPHLYVCGTAFNERKEFINNLADKENCVSYLDETINEEWLNKTCNIIKEQNRLIVAINNSTATAGELRTTMAKAVKEIIDRKNIKEIFIEGGSTAAAILQGLHIEELKPVNELQRGAVRMKANDLFITVKPGSYKLPEEITNIYFIN